MVEATTKAVERVSNERVADMLDEVAQLLEAQSARNYRVRAYRRAADVVRALPIRVAKVAQSGGRKALAELPAVGKSIASSIDEIVHTGRLAMLDRLEGEVSPEALFMLVPGIGPELAERIHHDLHIDTLEELELAVHRGELEELEGFGRRRTQAVRQALASMLSRSARRAARRIGPTHTTFSTAPPRHEPSVELLLRVDADYREHAEAGRLHKIAPRRFNPEGRAWLPIYHTEHEGWAFTALFSNTARAHRLGKTNDWVVIFFERDGDEGQRTVVTEYRGPREGQRVVRGRELG